MKVKHIEMTKLCLISTLMVVSAVSTAKETSVQSLSASTKASEIKWSAEVGTTYSSGLQKVDAIDYSSSADIEASLAATIDGTKYSFSSSVTKELTKQRELHLNNAYLGAARSLYKFNDEFALSGSLKLTLPLSEAAKDYQRLRTSIAATPTISWKNNQGLSLSYSPTAQVSFHEFKTSKTGASNYQYVAGNTLAATYSFVSGLYVYANASYSRLFSYDGNTKDSYRFTQLIGYPIDNFDLSFGHVMGGSPLAANGIETEVRLFDSRDSTIFGVLSVSF